MPVPHRMSPYTAVGLLAAFKQKQITLDESVFELCFDTVIQFLEETNDEKYRVTPRSEE